MRLEPLRRVATLGLRFVDAALGTCVSDGLRVVAYSSAQRNLPEHQRQRALAVPSPSGIWAFHTLPGLRAFGTGQGDAAYWDGLAGSRRRFTFEVVDHAGRFHPSRFERDAPQRFRPLAADPQEPDVVHLHATASRMIPPGQQAIYCELHQGGRAAAWAGLRVRGGGGGATGYAGADGSVVVILAHPDPMEAVETSPPTRPWQWAVRLEVARSATPSNTGSPEDRFMDLDRAADPFAELPLDGVRLVAGRPHLEHEAVPLKRLAL